MKKLIATLALGLAVAAPAFANAATQDAQFPLQADAGNRYEIIDQATGRPIAVLVPVAGEPGTLRFIGVTRTAAPAPPAQMPTTLQALTPGQMLDQLQRENDAGFHTTHDGG